MCNLPMAGQSRGSDPLVGIARGASPPAAEVRGVSPCLHVKWDAGQEGDTAPWGVCTVGPDCMADDGIDNLAVERRLSTMLLVPERT